jgi:RNA polymerase sigma-70 factor (ECF subfamily)
MILSLLFAAFAAPARDEEAALLRRIAAGDQRALRTLYDRCAGQALAVARRMLREPRDAEEIVQESFLEVWRRVDSYDPARGSASAWLCSIARNRAIDRLRSGQSAAKMKSQLGQQSEASPQPPPLEEAIARQERERIRAALDELPREQRQVLELAYFEGFTQTEIAERTGDALGTVKTRARLALKKLDQLLGEFAEGRP